MKTEEEKKEWKRQYYLRNKEAYLQRQKAWRIENKDRLSKSGWYQRNKVQFAIYKKEWKKRNPENAINWYRKQCVGNPQFKIKAACRTRIRTALLYKTTKSSRSGQLIGCSASFLMTHIESLWLPGMSWANYGVFGWHIDHKKPCAAFDLTSEVEQRKCFHWSNLQPLWAKDNLTKNDKFIE